MRDFQAEKYKKFVEDKNDLVIQNHENDEIKLIRSISDLDRRTVVDLGAGYGRAVTNLYKYAKNIVAIEINPNMYEELQRRAKGYSNVSVIVGDVANLTTILSGKLINDPIFIILENTLGTIEGDYKTVLKEMKDNARYYNGDVILSLYRQKYLRSWGIKTYEYGKEMYGEPDLKKTDFEIGLFVSKTGYTSKWWTDEEIKELKSFFGGKLLQEIKKEQYWIFHSSLK